MQEFKSGFVSLIGRTNVGKSTLLNTLIKEDVSITANKPQTTRLAIRAIANRENSQIIFIDTPGIHKPKSKLSETMVDTAMSSLKDVDVILFLIEATSNEVGKGDTYILEKLKEINKKVILIINKIDLVKKESLLNLINLYKECYDFSSVIPVEATKDKYADIVLAEIEKLLKPGPRFYEEDEYTDQTSRQMAEEKIREKALRFLNDEVPHGLYVEVNKFKDRKTSKGEEIYDIEATIYCKRDSHKGIIIGKDGSMLKRIGQCARKDLEKIFQSKINLKIWVKVDNKWDENTNILKKFKYTN
ncbi:MAG: GTPase Era [Clostridia bacterium]|jgi:GTP-binding protein Era|nr:GTPase Era [Clostridia bacterium]